MYKFITYDEPKCNTEQDLTTIGSRNVKVTFKTTKAHKQELDKLAAENGLSLSAFIVNCTKDKPFTKQDTLIFKYELLDRLRIAESACQAENYKAALSSIKQCAEFIQGV